MKWYDSVRSVDIRKRTALAKLEEIIQERRLIWLGCMTIMEDCRSQNRL